ncbi:MAG: hypothetical protein ACYC63_20490 [Armatimonadota bacterium]
MLRRGLPVTVGFSVAATPEEDGRPETVELTERARVRLEDRLDTRAETGETAETRAVGEVAGVVKQGSGRRLASPLPAAEARREALVGRLRAAEWQGAASELRGNIAEATPEGVAGDRAVAAEETGAALAGSGLSREATLEVTDTRVAGSGLTSGRVTGGAAVDRELKVRGLGRDAEAIGQERMTQRRQRRVEVEAEENLRLELVR